MDSRKWFGTVLWAILGLATSSAALLGQDEPVDYGLLPGNGRDSPPSFSETTAAESPCGGCDDVGRCPPCCCPRWTATADFIILDRIGSVNETLASRGTTSSTAVEVLNANDLQKGFSGGPRVDLIRHDDSGYDLELSYFQIDGWSSASTVQPNGETLYFFAPGAFEQLNEGKTMVWQYSSELFNAECNVRWNPDSRLTVLAGFRWVDLRENLVGTLEPPVFRREPPFWNTTTTNDLYGFQIGAEGKLLERGRFSIDALVKAGVYDDNAEQSTVPSIFKIVRPSSAATNHAAFVGETGLLCRYQITEGLSLRAGYEAMWLEGVALAPGQIQETYTTVGPVRVRALGVNCDSGAFYHGATAGLEISF